MNAIEFKVLKHKVTGLLMAASPSTPGFVLYAHTEEEIETKLVAEYAAFMEAIGSPLEGEYRVVDRTAPGYWPPIFELQPHHKVAA